MVRRAVLSFVAQWMRHFPWNPGGLLIENYSDKTGADLPPAPEPNRLPYRYCDGYGCCLAPDGFWDCLISFDSTSSPNRPVGTVSLVKVLNQLSTESGIQVTAPSLPRASKLKGIEAGANDFLAKPIDGHEIRLRVRNAVYTKHLYDQVRETLRKQMELEDLRDRLVHMMAHDMRAPLTSIDLTLQILAAEAAKLQAPWASKLQPGRDACDRVVEMINCMLDVSRLEGGQVPLNRAPHDILEICGKAAQGVMLSARKKELDFRVDGQPVFATVDADLVRRVIINLLWNAIKFAPERSRLVLAVSSADRVVRVSVRDQGPGIAPEHHQRVFDKFSQIKSAEGVKVHGVGLGLTFCKLAVEAHAGMIGVESDVGQGSTFWFTLPETAPA